MYTTEQLLARLDSAFKGILVPGDLGDSILQPVKFARFVRAMQHKAVILSEARFIKMEAQQVDIDRVGFVGRILKAGTDAGGNHRELSTPATDYAKPAFATNKLIAKELQAVCGIRDKSLRRNIEKGDFENTLVDLFGEAAGRDMEEFFILADTDIVWAEDDVLSLTDAWAKRAANKVYGLESAGSAGDEDFDPDDPESVFDALLKATPKQYLQNPSEWRIYTDWDLQDEYRNLLRARGTNLGDQAQTTGMGLAYKGYPIRYCPMLERSADYTDGTTGAGRIAMLQHPDNMAWGIFHEVTVERDRKPRDRRTDFVLTMEGDADYEDENAATVAFFDQEVTP